MLLLHGSAGSSALWGGMRERLGALYDVVAPDLIGYGDAPPWDEDRALTLADEARRVDALLPCCEGDIHVVGYSYGGAVALSLALAEPARIKTLTLIEPVFFAALRHGGEPEALDSLAEVRDRFAAAIQNADTEGGMRHFIEFWTGAGSWDRMPPHLRKAALAMAGKIRLDWLAAFAFDPTISALEPLAGRTLLVRGDRSPEPMRRLVDALHRLMPGSTHVVIRDANHLLPLTHESQIASALAAHLHAASEKRLR